MFRFGRKTVVAAAVTVAAIATGGGALAFWTGGVGEGISQVDDTDLTLKADFSLVGVAPGGYTPVTFTVSNRGDTDGGITQLTTTVEVTPVGDRVCPAGSFGFDTPTTYLNSTFAVPKGASGIPITWNSWSNDPVKLYLNFNNLPGTDQVGCKGAKVRVRVTSM